jgi:hypothetical protein
VLPRGRNFGLKTQKPYTFLSEKTAAKLLKICGSFFPRIDFLLQKNNAILLIYLFFPIILTTGIFESNILFVQICC